MSPRSLEEEEVPAPPGDTICVSQPGLCDGTFRERELSLHTEKLSGTLPKLLGTLSHVVYLSLTGPLLSGTLPTELGYMQKLETFQSEFNRISGTIPSEMARMISLKNLRLSNTRISGTMPPVGIEVFGTTKPRLGNVESLVLDHNRLSGTLPTLLQHLTKMENFWMNDNELSGTIPPAFGYLRQMEYLAIESNRFSGTLPPELAKFTKLRGISLNNNQFRGAVPSQYRSFKPSFCFLTNAQKNIQEGDTNVFACPLPDLNNACTLCHNTSRWGVMHNGGVDHVERCVQKLECSGTAQPTPPSPPLPPPEIPEKGPAEKAGGPFSASPSSTTHSVAVGAVTGVGVAGALLGIGFLAWRTPPPNGWTPRAHVRDTDRVGVAMSK